MKINLSIASCATKGREFEFVTSGGVKLWNWIGSIAPQRSFSFSQSVFSDLLLLILSRVHTPHPQECGTPTYPAVPAVTSTWNSVRTAPIVSFDRVNARKRKKCRTENGQLAVHRRVNAAWRMIVLSVQMCYSRGWTTYRPHWAHPPCSVKQLGVRKHNTTAQGIWELSNRRHIIKST